MTAQDISKKIYRLKRSFRANSPSKEVRHMTYKLSKILSRNWAKGLKLYDTLLGNQRLKMIALDLDGSALNNKKEIVPENLAALEELKREKPDIVICIATGRGYHQGLRYAKEMDADFLVTDNGGAIYRRVGNEYKLHKAVSIPEHESEAIYNKIKEYAAENPDLVWHFSTDSIENNYLIENGKDALKVANDTFYPGEPFGDGVLQVKNFEEIRELGFSQSTIKICVEFKKGEIGKKQFCDFEQYLNASGNNYFQTSASKIEIAPLGENKGTALLEITKTMQEKGVYISPHEILTGGNGKNDCPMFAIGTVSRGPENALEGLHENMVKSKKYDNNSRWIAEAIETFPEKTTRSTLNEWVEKSVNGFRNRTQQHDSPGQAEPSHSDPQKNKGR